MSGGWARTIEGADGLLSILLLFLRLLISISRFLHSASTSVTHAIHYEHARCITVREMARLHGFPDWFRLHATKWHGARQIGNAVPPPLAQAIAAEVMKALGAAPATVAQGIDLGDPALLAMAMAAAAEHFGVDAPNGRRDRKSGAVKRKQHVIEAERLMVSI